MKIEIDNQIIDIPEERLKTLKRLCNARKNKDLCWIWSGSFVGQRKTGAIFSIAGKPWPVARLIAAIVKKDKLLSGRIYKTCGNKKCVNHRHFSNSLKFN